ncbi:MAG: hypothetical protein M3483_06460, partial [Gemmatimonadota bacterium]|nr:hypothetical protein [Gemmatimonadota bacterium]
IGFLDELAAAGFRCYRSPDPLSIEVPTRQGRSAGGVLADFIGMAPPLVSPMVQDGLVAIPGSLMVRYAEGWRARIPDAMRARRLASGLSQLARRGGIFHVWLHPINLYAERPRLENVLGEFCERVGELVAAGAVRCRTMGQIADEVFPLTTEPIQ